MQTNPGRFLTIALFASLACGQTGRVLQFSHVSTAQNMDEIATVVRVMTDSEVSSDAAQRTLTVNGPAEQIALAEWLFGELDTPQVTAPNNADQAVHRYRLQGGGDNSARVFFLHNTASAQDLQSIGTAMRTITDMKRVGTYTGSSIIAARGTADQIELATWLVDVLDRSAGQTTSVDYRLPLSGDPEGQVTIRVLYPSHAATIQDFQEIATAARTVADVRRVFTYNASKALILRSTPERIELCAWVVQQLDQPAVGAPGAPAAASFKTYEFDTPNDRDNMVKVFYIPQTATIQDFQQFATGLRKATNIRRVFTYNAPRAMAVRGTVDQVALAERIVKELENPK